MGTHMDAQFIEIDGQRFEFESARIWLYHCDSLEADWNLRLTRRGADGLAQTLWLAGTVAPSLARSTDLDGRELKLELRDLDGVFEQLLHAPITTFPGGQLDCSASLTAALVSVDTIADATKIALTCAFEFDWDRELDPPDASYPTPRTARIELRAGVGGLYGGPLPDAVFDA